MANIDRRIAEAEKLGFKGAIVPASNFQSLKKKPTMKIKSVDKLSEAVDIFIS